jgi:hypothetical protein
MALAPNTPPFVSGSILTAAQMTALPMGIVGYTKYQAGNQTLDSRTAVDITGMTSTFTAVSTRLYKVSYFVSARKNSNAGYTYINVVQGATTINETGATNVAGGYFILTGISFLSGLSGSQTVKLQAYNENANTTLYAVAGSPMWLSIEDVGLAP